MGKLIGLIFVAHVVAFCGIDPKQEPYQDPTLVCDDTCEQEVAYNERYYTADYVDCLQRYEAWSLATNETVTIELNERGKLFCNNLMRRE